VVCFLVVVEKMVLLEVILDVSEEAAGCLKGVG
jgi:hypothetical protein